MEFRGCRDLSDEDDARTQSDLSSGDGSDSEEGLDKFLHPSIRQGLYPFYFIHSGLPSASSASANVPASSLLSNRGRIPLELEFIGTCIAVSPKIVITTAHHYDARNDDVGRFGVLVECTANTSQALRKQQQQQPPKESVVQPQPSTSDKRNKSAKRTNKEITPKPKPELRRPTLIYANEKLYYLIPCRYGAKAPPNISWFKGAGPQIATEPEAQVDAEKIDGRAESEEVAQGKKGRKSKRIKDAKIVTMPRVKETPTNSQYKISPDVATFWLESALPHFVPSPQHFSACSTVEGTRVTTVFYEPPKVRLLAHAVGTYVVQNKDETTPDGVSSEIATDNSGRTISLFGKQNQSKTKGPSQADCILIAPKAAAVLRMVVVTMRTQTLPLLIQSSGEVLCGIACEGYHKEAKTGHQTKTDEIPGEEAIIKKEDDAKAERRRKAKIVYDVDDDDIAATAQRTRQTNTGKGKYDRLYTNEGEGEQTPRDQQKNPTAQNFPLRYNRSHHMVIDMDDSSEDETSARPTHNRQFAIRNYAPRLDVVIPANFEQGPSGRGWQLGAKREREECDESDIRLVLAGSREGTLGTSLTSIESVNSKSPAPTVSPFPPLTMSNSPFVWWHSCLTRDTVTPLGSSGGAVIDASGSLIVGMHVATNNLFTYYRYYGPKQERILRSLYVRQRQWRLEQQRLKMKLEEGVKTESDVEAKLIDEELEIAALQAAIRKTPITTVPPKNAKDGRISEFVTSRSLIQALTTMQVYLNAASN